ncbi:retrovirus-related pol polyprotein from transposon TNT 1-94 [Tanacetum coccineum]
MAIARAREIIGSQVVQQTGIQCFNCKEFRHFTKEIRKPKKAKDYTYHKEKMLMCKQAKKGSDADPLEKNAKECDDERVVLANLIANLKLNTDENKKIQKQLKKANTSLSYELQECKSALEECKSFLEKSNRTRDRYLGALHDKEVELEKKCVFNSNHDACVSKFINDVNASTKKPKLVPISTRKPKSQANKSVATPHKKTVASDSTIQKSKSYFKMLYEKTNQIVQLILFIVDSGCTKNMTGNLKLFCMFVETYLGTVHFGNDQFAPILGYRDFGNDLLTGNCGFDLYTISLQDTMSPTPICFMAKALLTQAWLWHLRLSHFNFNTINLILNKDIVIGLLKLKYIKDQLCSSCELGKAKRSTFKKKTVASLKGQLNLLHMELCGLMLIESINGKKYTLTSDHNRSELIIQDHNNEPSSSMLVPNVSLPADTNASSLQELEFLFSPLFEEYFTIGNQSVSKSFTLSDNSKQQETQPTTTIQPTTELITPTTNVNAEENNNDQAENAQINENEFYNTFSTPVREEAESSTCYVDN